MRKKITLIILVKNEITGIREIMPKVQLDLFDEVAVVDGGSTDGSREYFNHAGIRVITQTKPGRGEAFREAFANTSGDALIFFSPDGNENPADLDKFRPFLEMNTALVIGTRMACGGVNEEDGNFFKFRKWANNFFSLIANIFFNRHQSFVTDTINGFRAITRDAWNTLSPDGPGYTIEYQTSIRAMKKGMTILEFPTAEGQRCDLREGSPSIQTGLAFIKIFFKELRKGCKSGN